ncbi:MAG: CapA family protein [Bacteroidota bacterium]
MTRVACLLAGLILTGCSPSEPATFRIVFGGDVMLDRGVAQTIQRLGVDTIFHAITPELQRADAAIANLECVLTNRTQAVDKRFTFRGKPEWANALRQAGFTHANLANNHSLDYGAAGLADTRKHLEEHHIRAIGVHPCQPELLTKGTDTVAVFAATPLANVASDSTDRLQLCERSMGVLARTVSSYSTRHPNHVMLVTVHWGWEGQPKPEQQQVAQAHTLIDAGAQFVIGHGPHVRQPLETYRHGTIVYSLGNLVFDGTTPETRIGNLAVLSRLHDRWGLELQPVVMRKGIPVPLNKEVPGKGSG